MYGSTVSKYAENTLGYHLDMCRVIFPENSKAIKFLEDKIKESPHGPNEKVICAESQMIEILVKLDLGGRGK